MWNRLTSGARTVLAAVVVLLLLGAAMFFVVRRIQDNAKRQLVESAKVITSVANIEHARLQLRADSLTEVLQHTMVDASRSSDSARQMIQRLRVRLAQAQGPSIPTVATTDVDTATSPTLPASPTLFQQTEATLQRCEAALNDCDRLRVAFQRLQVVSDSAAIAASRTQNALALRLADSEHKLTHAPTKQTLFKIGGVSFVLGGIACLFLCR